MMCIRYFTNQLSIEQANYSDACAGKTPRGVWTQQSDAMGTTATVNTDKTNSKTINAVFPK